MSKNSYLHSSTVLAPDLTSGCLEGSNFSLISSISSVPLPLASNFLNAYFTRLTLKSFSSPNRAYKNSSKLIVPSLFLSKMLNKLEVSSSVAPTL